MMEDTRETLEKGTRYTFTHGEHLPKGCHAELVSASIIMRSRNKFGMTDRSVKMMRRYILNSLVAVFFIIGCATTQSQVQVTEQSKKVDVNTVISQLSQQISSTMLEQNKRRVAVMNFTLQTGEITELGLYLSDKLTNSLFRYRDKFEVVERTRLESALKEMRLGMTGIFDDKTAQSIGKVLGADALVIGTITDLGGEVDINIRMLGTERANVLAVASSFLEKSDAIVKLMKSGRITETGTTITKPSQPKAMPKVEVKDFIFEAKECKVSGQKVTCSISVINNDQKTREIGIIIHSPTNSIMVDDLGNQYSVAIAQFGKNRSAREYGAIYIFDIWHDVPPNLSMNLVLRYDEVSSVAKYANIVVDFIHPRWDGKLSKAVLRNIPLSR